MCLIQITWRHNFATKQAATENDNPCFPGIKMCWRRRLFDSEMELSFGSVQSNGYKNRNVLLLSNADVTTLWVTCKWTRAPNELGVWLLTIQKEKESKNKLVVEILLFLT